MVMAPLVVHAGYPKTATTTFQTHVFPGHPEIEYLGKFIPSFRYTDDRLHVGINNILHQDMLRFSGAIELRDLVLQIRAESRRNCVLISSESFIHPSVVDLALVADRAEEVFGHCKILITIREQISAIKSFYWMHGRFGQYLTIGPKEAGEAIEYPLPFSHWLRFQRSVESQNYLGTLHYDAVIAHYIRRFGANNVCVLLYERFVTDPAHYAEQLGSFLGVDVPTLLSLMSGKHKLASVAREVVPRAKRPAFDLLAKLGISMNSQIEETAVFDDEELAVLRQHYRAGNERLMAELFLPLGRFGYSI